ncbi:MAG: 3-deoxy-manno-octulosonate cytidylyltransferase [Nitrospirae bacterium]|nr:3-deoxy-manno-octulosonate cytidylyltransferase [Nitrospirota bacterium]
MSLPKTQSFQGIPSRPPEADVSQVIALIPARYGSTRFPGKPLALLHGRPMIQHVYERARQAALVEEVLVATDDARILEAVRAFGGEAVITGTHHRTGTERVAEVAALRSAEIVVNVQGDEPLIDPRAIDAAVRPLLEDPSLEMATLATPIRRAEELFDPHVVKVVVNQQGDALYFSRAPIPFNRSQKFFTSPPSLALPPSRGEESGGGGRSKVRRQLSGFSYRHVGLYAYRRDFLLRMAQWPPTPLEEAERLEQLRVLEHGHRIRVVLVDDSAPGVDTPEDLERIRILKSRVKSQKSGVKSQESGEKR